MQETLRSWTRGAPRNKLRTAPRRKVQNNGPFPDARELGRLPIDVHSTVLALLDTGVNGSFQ